MGIDFVGPLPEASLGIKFILVLVDYFSRFIIPFTTKIANIKDIT